jgi:hypothetical protein
VLTGRTHWAGGELATGPLAARHPILAPDPVSDGYLYLEYGPLKAPFTTSPHFGAGVEAHLDRNDKSLSLRVDARGSRHPLGGPFAGVGTITGSDAALRVRGGWEMAPRPWLIGALVAESDLRRRWIAAATIEAASPAVAFIPSLSLGVGVPFQFAPTARAGMRFMSTAHLPYAGVAFTFDVYPSTANESILTEFAVVVRAGF